MNGDRGHAALDDSRSVYRFIELGAHLGPERMARNQFVSAEDADAVLRWRERHGNRDVYASLCRFTEANRDSVYDCPFVLDIDVDGDLEAARGEAVRACELLGNRLGIGPESLDIFFSGCMGFHILIPLEVFCAAGMPDLLDLWRALAARIANEGVPHVDRGLYTRSRLLRLPDSIHSRSSLYKIALDHAELVHTSAQEIAQLARAPRGLRSMADGSPVPRAVDWFRRAVAWRERRQRPTASPLHGALDGWRTPPCVRAAEQAVLPDGCRHDCYFALARFCASIGMASAEALERLRQIDARHPIHDPDYLPRTVTNARKCPGFHGCPNRALARFCDPDRCAMRREDMKTSSIEHAPASDVGNTAGS